MGIQSVIFGKKAVSKVKAPCTAFSINTRFSLTEHRTSAGHPEIELINQYGY